MDKYCSIPKGCGKNVWFNETGAKGVADYARVYFAFDSGEDGARTNGF